MSELSPASLEVFRHRLEGIATEMGRTLIRGAFSPNIKEREDASTAIFDTNGRLVAQAEHIPVHLGAMPDAVGAVLEQDPQPNDIFILNDPYRGGTHLPDVTIVGTIAPRNETIGFAAVRAHHADVGGSVPGSLPAGAREIFEEGIRIPPTRIDDGVLPIVLANVRNPGQRKADFDAMLGAVAIGRQRIGDLVKDHGESTVRTAFEAVIAYSRERTETRLATLPDGEFEALDWLEGDGISDEPIPISATVTIDGSNVTVDFSGSAQQVEGNLNAPPAVAKSAVYFVFRCVTDPDIPANHGCFEPLTIEIPIGTVLRPRPPAAVSGGNVETSQRVVDVLVQAMRQADPNLPACSQGTMNNLIIGHQDPDSGTYYETIGGGAGATPSHDGTDGIHTGMTNTKNTPVEVVEREYPMLVTRYGLRRDSGGMGTYRGGLGIERSILIESPATVSVIAERRSIGPCGVAGGEAGTVGANLLDGKEIDAKETRTVPAGTEITILTPGGGGFGPVADRDEIRFDSDRRDGKTS